MSGVRTQILLLARTADTTRAQVPLLHRRRVSGHSPTTAISADRVKRVTVAVHHSALLQAMVPPTSVPSQAHRSFPHLSVPSSRHSWSHLAQAPLPRATVIHDGSCLVPAALVLPENSRLVRRPLKEDSRRYACSRHRGVLPLSRTCRDVRDSRVARPCRPNPSGIGKIRSTQFQSEPADPG